MGMDVYGIKPKTQKGEYFRNNVWYWHPLWDYCCSVDSSLIQKVPNAHSNVGDGLDAIESRKLGFLIKATVQDGSAEKYVQDYYENMEKLEPRLCRCTINAPKNELLTIMLSGLIYAPEGDNPFPNYDIKDPDSDCNLCSGSGKLPNYGCNYHITLDNISSFADFLIDCGGFQIC